MNLSGMAFVGWISSLRCNCKYVLQRVLHNQKILTLRRHCILILTKMVITKFLRPLPLLTVKRNSDVKVFENRTFTRTAACYVLWPNIDFSLLSVANIVVQRFVMIPVWELTKQNCFAKKTDLKQSFICFKFPL